MQRDLFTDCNSRWSEKHIVEMFLDTSMPKRGSNGSAINCAPRKSFRESYSLKDLLLFKIITNLWLAKSKQSQFWQGY